MVSVLRPGQRIVNIPGIGVQTSRRAVSVAAAQTVVLRDTFTAANGTLLSAHAPDIGAFAWAATAPWTINNNQAGNNASYLDYATIDPGVSNYRISAVVRLEATSSTVCRGFVVRYVSLVDFASVGLKYTANRFGIYDYANVVMADTAFTVSPNTDYTIEAILTGTTITATINGGNQVVYNGIAASGSRLGMRLRWSGDAIKELEITI